MKKGKGGYFQTLGIRIILHVLHWLPISSYIQTRYLILILFKFFQSWKKSMWAGLTIICKGYSFVEKRIKWWHYLQCSNSRTIPLLLTTTRGFHACYVYMCIYIYIFHINDVGGSDEVLLHRRLGIRQWIPTPGWNPESFPGCQWNQVDFYWRQKRRFCLQSSKEILYIDYRFIRVVIFGLFANFECYKVYII